MTAIARILIASGLVLGWATAHADTKVYESAQVQLDVPNDWKVSPTDNGVMFSDPTSSLVIFMRLFDGSAAEAAIKEVDGLIKRSIEHVKWRAKPVSRDVNGLKALGVSGTGLLQGNKVDIHALIVITPSSRPMLVYRVIGHSRSAALQPQIDAFINSIRPTHTEVAQRPRPTGAARFSVIYQRPESKQYQAAAQFSHTIKLEAQVDTLNKLVVLPRGVPIEVRECGTVNAFYSSDDHNVSVCYELIEYFAGIFQGVFKDAETVLKLTAGAVRFTLMHEIAHALTHELDLPVTGNEEDSADEFAAILLGDSGEDGRIAALAAVVWFRAEGDRKVTAKQVQWSDEHSFDLQRMYGVLCVLFAEDPASMARVVSEQDMPTDRLQRCMRDYPRKVKAWRELLKPYMRNSK